MPDLTLTRGDSKSYSVTFYDTDGTTPLDLAGAVIRCAIKQRPSDLNADAKVFKTSYFAEELEIVAPTTNGQAVLKLIAPDTDSMDPGTYKWEIELTRQGALASSAGSLTVGADGDNFFASTGVDFTKVFVGDIIVPTGAFAGNQVPVAITAIDSDTGVITVGAYNLLQAEAGISFNCYRGNRATPSGLSGDFVLCPDVVR